MTRLSSGSPSATSSAGSESSSDRPSGPWASMTAWTASVGPITRKPPTSAVERSPRGRHRHLRVVAALGSPPDQLAGEALGPVLVADLEQQRLLDVVAGAGDQCDGRLAAEPGAHVAGVVDPRPGGAGKPGHELRGQGRQASREVDGALVLLAVGVGVDVDVEQRVAGDDRRGVVVGRAAPGSRQPAGQRGEDQEGDHDDREHRPAADRDAAAVGRGEPVPRRRALDDDQFRAPRRGRCRRPGRGTRGAAGAAAACIPVRWREARPRRRVIPESPRSRCRFPICSRFTFARCPRAGPIAAPARRAGCGGRSRRRPGRRGAHSARAGGSRGGRPSRARSGAGR